MKDVKMVVQCVTCSTTKELKASEGPHGMQMCRRCGGVMVPVKASAR